jgi:hypothetical protein
LPSGASARAAARTSSSTVTDTLLAMVENLLRSDQLVAPHEMAGSDSATGRRSPTMFSLSACNEVVASRDGVSDLHEMEC